jgi:di/tricarboxylate transporter
MVGILTSALILWFTDDIHGISPAWIGLAAAIICLVPRIGPARGTTISEGVNFSVWFMLAAFISMGAVMKHSGAGAAFGATVVDTLQLQSDNNFLNFLSIVGINHLVNLGTTQMSSPAVAAVLSQSIAEAINWPLEAVFLVQASAWSMPLLPYEIPMMAVGLGMGGVTMRRATMLLLTLAAFGVSVILPAQFLWLQFLGIIP